MTGEPRGKWNIIAILAPVALATLFFYPVIFAGKTFYAFDILKSFSPWATPGADFRAHNPLISDPVNVFYPYLHHLKSAVGQGVFPLWNDSNLCGVSYAPPSHPLVYALYLLFPMTFAHDLLLWLHLLAVGLFMHLYLREIGLRPVASLIGSISWMFNGYVMVWFEFENVPMMAASLPMVLLLMERWLRTRTKTAYILLIGAMAFSICVNYAHLLIYQFVFLGVYAAYRFFGDVGHRKERGVRIGWKEMTRLAAAFLLAVVISANFFTNHLSYLEDPQRTRFSFETLFHSIGRLPAEYLVTLVFPDFYGSPALPFCFTPGNQSYSNYNELCLYCGIPALLLALTCVPYARERFAGFYLLSALVAISMAMGSILYYPLAAYIPGLNMSTPTRILYVFGFSVSVLASLGTQALLGRDDRRKWWVVALWAFVLVSGIGLVLFVQTARGLHWATGSVRVIDPEAFYSYIRGFFHVFSPILLKPLLLLVLSVYLLCAFVLTRKPVFLAFVMVALLYDLISFGWSYNTASPRRLEYPETRAIHFLQKDQEPFRIASYGNILQNTLAPFGIQDIGGYSSFYSKRYGDFLHLSQSGLEISPPGQNSRWVSFHSFGSPLLDLVNVKYLLTSPNVSVESEKTELVYSGEMNIYRNKASFPRAFFVPNALVLGKKEEVYRAMGRFSDEDFRTRVILEASSRPTSGEGEDGGTEGAQAVVKILGRQVNKMVIETNGSREGFIVISDNFHPGWKAYLDGVEVPVMRANYIMMAIAVKKGEHRIQLLFRPRLLMAGSLVSALGWCVLLLLLLQNTLPRSIRKGSIGSS